MEEALKILEQLLREDGKGFVCLTGVHGIMEARRDRSLLQTLNRAFLCLPDGMPTVWVGHLQGHRSMRRVYGPDFMLQFCARSAMRGDRHFLYGGNRGVAEKLKDRLEAIFPFIKIVGTYTPPFRKLTADEESELAGLIDRSSPDVIWVGLSTPKQERFMAQHVDRFNTKLLIGVGAAFDINAGLLRDAPDWVKSCGLQWLDRLLREPRRLWKRYLQNNPSFLINITLQISGIRRFKLD